MGLAPLSPVGTPAPYGDPAAPAPRFRALSTAECVSLLKGQQVGRLAYVHHGQVGIVPIHYAYADGWLYGRTAAGAKIAALRHHPWVAFEVDEIAGTFEWRSVVVRGAFYLIARDGPGGDRQRWGRAVELLRRLVPATFAPGDPTPGRDLVFRIHVGELTGRAATTHPDG